MSQNDFKTLRTQLGLSLKDVALATKIRISNLQAIEENDFASLPEPVYAKGYIKEYAKFLKISPDEKLLEYDAFLNKSKQLTHTTHDKIAKEATSTQFNKTETTNQKKLKPQSTNASSKNNISVKNVLGLLFVGIIAFVFGAYTYLHLFTSFDFSDNNTLPPLPPVPKPVENYSKVDNMTNADNKTVLVSVDNTSISQTTHIDNKSTDTIREIKKKRHILQITATQKTWLFIKPDNSSGFEKTLNPADNLTVEATRTIFLKVGNAAGVDLKFNGKVLPKLGEPNAVKSIVLPFDLQKLDNSTR